MSRSRILRAFAALLLIAAFSGGFIAWYRYSPTPVYVKFGIGEVVFIGVLVAVWGLIDYAIKGRRGPGPAHPARRACVAARANAVDVDDLIRSVEEDLTEDEQEQINSLLLGFGERS